MGIPKLQTRLIFSVVVASFLVTLGSAEVTFDWATIGDPGVPVLFGEVDYVYRISKHEVTNDQYVEYLNALSGVTASGGVFRDEMQETANGGIVRLGDGTEESPFEYAAKPGYGRKPVVYVSAVSAMYFINWLEQGQPQNVTVPELHASGTYVEFGSSTTAPAPGSNYRIPSVGEWHKAAAYDPSTQSYFRFSTASDERPFSISPQDDSPSASNSANIYVDDELANGYNDGYAVSGTTQFEEAQVYLTDVGSYVDSVSPHGTWDQTGNVQEIVYPGGEGSSYWATIGGSYARWDGPRPIDFTEADAALEIGGNAIGPDVGFRVVSRAVPEPVVSGPLAGLLGMLLWGMARRKREWS